MLETPFFQRIQELISVEEEDLLENMRKKAKKRLMTLDLPQRNVEAFQYVPLRHLYETSFARPKKSEISKEKITPHVLPECRGSCLVFVNGNFSEELSLTSNLPPSLVILSTSKALASFRQFMQNRQDKMLPEETDYFAVLNEAAQQKGLFVYVPPKLCVEVPIQCLHIIDEEDETPFVLFPRVQLVAGAQSQLSWISQVVSETKAPSHWVNALFDLAVEEGAQLQVTQANLAESKGWHFESVRMTLKRDSQVKGFFFNQGSRAVRQDIKALLSQENSEVSLKGIALLNGLNQSHVHSLIDHQAPHCQSSQLFKHVLGDASQASFEGKILVRQKAQKTQAYQMNNHLLLGERAQAHSKPNLEIFADDVKASHGATVSQLNEELLFYLRTRGVDALNAQTLLIEGFCRDVLRHVPLNSLQDKMLKKVHQDLRGSFHS